MILRNSIQSTAVLGLVCLGILQHELTAQEIEVSKNPTQQNNLWTRSGLDWPSFLGPNRDGKSAEKGLDFAWSDQNPKVIWKVRVGEGYGIGSLAEGRYFHFDRFRDEARLRAFHAETGELLWEFKYPTTYSDMYGFDGGPRSSPVIDEGRVYIHGVEGLLHCLDTKTGQEIWSLDTNEKFGVIQNFFGVGSTPLVYKDLLIVMIGGSPAADREIPFGRLAEVKPNGSGIVAFDKRTGAVRYQTINDLASYASPVVCNFNGRPTGLALTRSGLFSFNPDTGEVGFEFPFRARKYESVNASTPVVSGSQILLTESYGPGGVLLDSTEDPPKPVWADDGGRDRALACHWNTPIIVDGYAYGSSGEKTAQAMLRCVRLTDGQVMWEQPRLTRCSLTLVDGHLICLCEDGRLFSFQPDPTQFIPIGEVQSEDIRLVYPCWANPVVSHGYLYVRGKAFVWCLDISKKP